MSLVPSGSGHLPMSCVSKRALVWVTVSIIKYRQINCFPVSASRVIKPEQHLGCYRFGSLTSNCLGEWFLFFSSLRGRVPT